MSGKLKLGIIGIIIAALVAITIWASGGSASAAVRHLFGSKDIRNNSLQSVDIKNGTIQRQDLNPAFAFSLKGKPGATGRSGSNANLGLYYATAAYDVGDTNAGAIATVACKNTSDVALSGGVQVLGLDAGANSRNTPVSSSFPGRMDWSTNAPKPGRLDGWIVQFGGNAGATSDKDPQKETVWALCARGSEVGPTVETYRQSD